MPAAGLSAFLALAWLFWSGNWIAGRALREDLDQIARNFWRRGIAVALLGRRRAAGLLAGALVCALVLGAALLPVGVLPSPLPPFVPTSLWPIFRPST